MLAISSLRALKKRRLTAPVLLTGALLMSPFPEGPVPTPVEKVQGRFQESLTPEKGVFLVASSDLTDPRFHHSVVLLLAHGEDGTLGLIINRASKIPLSKVLPDLESPGVSSTLLFFGGPVGLNGLLFLIRSDTPPERATPVMKDVYFSGDRRLLENFLDQKQDFRDLRVYVGRAGWAPGQLEDEIARGSWGLVQGDSDTVFEKDLDDIWRDLSGPPETPNFIARGGVKPGYLAQFVSLYAYTYRWVMES